MTRIFHFTCRDLSSEYSYDPEYRFRYLSREETSAESGLSRVSERERTYGDRNGDGTYDLVTDALTVSGKTGYAVQDVILSQKTVTSPENRTVTYEYDPVTLLTERIRVPGLNLTVFGYDTRGRLTSVTSGTRQSLFAYDSSGNLSSVTDPENRTAAYDHDAAGRVTAVHRPDSSSVHFTYDKNGNMTVLTNPNPADHGFGYNSVNRNTSYQTPVSGQYQYVYDRDRAPDKDRAALRK